MFLQSDDWIAPGPLREYFTPSISIYHDLHPMLDSCEIFCYIVSLTKSGPSKRSFPQYQSCYYVARKPSDVSCLLVFISLTIFVSANTFACGFYSIFACCFVCRWSKGFPQNFPFEYSQSLFVGYYQGLCFAVIYTYWSYNSFIQVILYSSCQVFRFHQMLQCIETSVSCL